MVNNKGRPGGNRPAKHSDFPAILGVLWKSVSVIAGLAAVLAGINAFLSLSGKAKYETLAALSILLLAIALFAKLYFYLKKSSLSPRAIYITLGAMVVAIIIALAASITAFRLISPVVQAQPTPVPSANPDPTGLPTSIPIPMSAACKWAYPRQASGKTVGSLYNTYCLGPNGENLGGFSGMHSLNNWCAIPSHTDGENGLQPELVNEVWTCT